MQHCLSLIMIRQSLGSTLTLHQKLHTSAHPVCLDDPDHGSYAIEIFRKWVINVVSLRYSKHATIAVQRLLNRFNGSRSTG